MRARPARSPGQSGLRYFSARYRLIAADSHITSLSSSIVGTRPFGLSERYQWLLTLGVVDRIELIPAPCSRGGSEVPHSILLGANVLIEPITPLRHEIRQPGRIQSEGPSLARGFKCREQAGRAEERCRIVEDPSMNVREYDLT